MTIRNNREYYSMLKWDKKFKLELGWMRQAQREYDASGVSILFGEQDMTDHIIAVEKEYEGLKLEMIEYETRINEDAN